MEAEETICERMGELDGDPCPIRCNSHHGLQACKYFFLLVFVVYVS